MEKDSIIQKTKDWANRNKVIVSAILASTATLVINKLTGKRQEIDYSKVKEITKTQKAPITYKTKKGNEISAFKKETTKIKFK